MLGNPIGTRVIYVDETDSTNSYASRLIYDQQPHEGTVIVAGFQSAGRGQRGSGWESEKGMNLLASYILYPTFLPAEHHFLLNQALSLSIYEFIRFNTTAEIFIKWPNDILAGNRKIAGLLVENSIRNNRFSSTIGGIGININQTAFQEYSPQATSLQLLENKTFNLDKCLHGLSKFVDKWYAVLRAGNYRKITETYSGALFGLEKTVAFERNGQEFTAVIKGVNPSGQLVLDNHSGTELIFNTKELKFKL